MRAALLDTARFSPVSSSNRTAWRMRMPQDMLDRLRLDPGTRTYGELLQEREWAVYEIERLRSEATSVLPTYTGQKAPDPVPSMIEAHTAGDAVLTPHRLLRLPEVCRLTGLGRSSIYRMVGGGRFPPPVKVGFRCTRWRVADVLAWQAHIAARQRAT
jgi:prophage regulatory protein